MGWSGIAAFRPRISNDEKKSDNRHAAWRMRPPSPIERSEATNGKPHKMLRLVYVSSAIVPFSRADLLDLMAISRERNAKSGITGLLLYKDGNFMQLLEGEESSVRETYDRIARDPRHHGLLILLNGPVVERSFPNWSMSFRDLNSPEVISAPGFSPFLNTPLTAREFSSDPTRGEKLLVTFKDRM